jgi:hypothetical protein
LFEGRLPSNADDAVALEELAEAHHLSARLPMHAPISPGREADAFARGLEHAQAVGNMLLLNNACWQPSPASHSLAM